MEHFNENIEEVSLHSRRETESIEGKRQTLTQHQPKVDALLAVPHSATAELGTLQ